MNCVEFESVTAGVPGGSAYLRAAGAFGLMSACSGLLSDLNLISSQAESLLAADEPRPAVWNALESRLRSEGLIRDSEPVSVPVPFKESLLHRWRAAWLVPVAAALAIVAGLKLYHPSGARRQCSNRKATPGCDRTCRTRGIRESSGLD